MSWMLRRRSRHEDHNTLLYLLRHVDTWMALKSAPCCSTMASNASRPWASDKRLVRSLGSRCINCRSHISWTGHERLITHTQRRF
jgi:hypothetical protein